MNTFGFSKNSNRSLGKYITKKEDSLHKIATKFNLNIEQIAKDNNLKNIVIFKDQIIVIPRKNNGTYFEEYIVLENDTIITISKNVKVPIEVLLKYNDFTKLIIEENQILLLPTRSELYKVSLSDNYYTIMNKFNLSLEELVSLNASKWFKVGEEIKIK